MRAFILGALALGLSAAAAAAQPVLEIRDAAVRVTVITEDRSTLQVSIVHQNERLPIRLNNQGSRIIVDGNLPPMGTSCIGLGDTVRVMTEFVVPVSYADMPQVVVRAPRNVIVETHRGAVFGQVGPSQSLSLTTGGCGRWTAGDVAGALRVVNAGSSDFRGANAARAEFVLAGSGDAAVARIAGPVTARIPGSGDLTIGSAGSAQVTVLGSGDVRLGATPGGLRGTITGSGDLRAEQASGPVVLRIMGSGDVAVRGGQASALTATVLGSGDIRYGGEVQTLDATIMGSGDIWIHRVSGPVRQRVRGSGDVRIGG